MMESNCSEPATDGSFSPKASCENSDVEDEYATKASNEDVKVILSIDEEEESIKCEDSSGLPSTQNASKSNDKLHETSSKCEENKNQSFWSTESKNFKLFITSLGVKMEPCHGCKKNCSSNLLCYSCLGQSKWVVSKEKLAKTYNNKLYKIENEQSRFNKAKTIPLGLRNLGATCYVNIYLQLWFHNLSFRSAVYAAKLEEGSSSEAFYPFISSLKYIFAELEKSHSLIVNPSSLIDALRLKHNSQQDASEFSKLMITLMEGHPELNVALNKEFRGSYAYSQKCLHCSRITERETTFYELDLQMCEGITTLQGLISNYLKEERLIGENQYNCGNCKRHRDAVRHIELKSLPNSLTFHLLRFVYNIQLGARTKIHNAVSFPNKIDMSQFMNDKSTSIEYKLTAVLLHRGQYASSGHFLTHIMNQQDNNWYMFNDEEVVKLPRRGGCNLNSEKATTEEIKSNSNKRRKVQITNNENSSKDAYMLVYTRVNNNVEIKPCVPSDLAGMIEKENDSLLSDKADFYSKRHQDAKVEYNRKLDRLSFIEELTNTANANQWVSTDQIRSFFNIKTSTVEVLKKYKLCLHDKISPNILSSYKLVSKKAADILHENNAKKLNFQSFSAVCKICTHSYYVMLESKTKLQSEHKTAEEIIKQHSRGDIQYHTSNLYYIGTTSLKKWKQIILKNMESGFNSEVSYVLNEDLLCEHKSINHDERNYTIIPGNAWAIIRKYFKKYLERKFDTYEPCKVCVEIQGVKDSLDCDLKMRANKEKQLLKDLYFGRGRPKKFVFKGQSSRLCEDKFFIIPKQFLAAWRRFIQLSLKDTSKSKKESNIDQETGLQIKNSDFLCAHGRFVYDPVAIALDDELEFDIPKSVLLWANEWATLKEIYPYDHELYIRIPVINNCKVVLTKLDQETNSTDTDSSPYIGDNRPTNDEEELFNVQEDGERVKYICSPSCCQQCTAEMIDAQSKKDFVYENVKMIVKLSDLTFLEMKKSLENIDVPLKPPNNCRPKRLARGEKYVPGISSTFTLKELKIAIMGVLQIAPFDQNIFVNGVYHVDDDTKTLEDLCISRYSVLHVTEDKPDESFDSSEVEKQVEDVEAGFKGTLLLGGMI